MNNDLYGHFDPDQEPPCVHCLLGFWGTSCTELCDCNARGSCDRETGTGCLCFADTTHGFWAGSTCSECATGWFGASCTATNVPVSAFLSSDVLQLQGTRPIMLTLPETDIVVMGGSPLLVFRLDGSRLEYVSFTSVCSPVTGAFYDAEEQVLFVSSFGTPDTPEDCLAGIYFDFDPASPKLISDTTLYPFRKTSPPLLTPTPDPILTPDPKDALTSGKVSLLTEDRPAPDFQKHMPAFANNRVPVKQKSNTLSVAPDTSAWLEVYGDSVDKSVVILSVNATSLLLTLVPAFPSPEDQAALMDVRSLYHDMSVWYASISASCHTGGLGSALDPWGYIIVGGSGPSGARLLAFSAKKGSFYTQPLDLLDGPAAPPFCLKGACDGVHQLICEEEPRSRGAAARVAGALSSSDGISVFVMTLDGDPNAADSTTKLLGHLAVASSTGGSPAAATALARDPDDVAYYVAVTPDLGNHLPSTVYRIHFSTRAGLEPSGYRDFSSNPDGTHELVVGFTASSGSRSMFALVAFQSPGSAGMSTATTATIPMYTINQIRPDKINLQPPEHDRVLKIDVGDLELDEDEHRVTCMYSTQHKVSFAEVNYPDACKTLPDQTACSLPAFAGLGLQGTCRSGICAVIKEGFFDSEKIAEAGGGFDYVHCQPLNDVQLLCETRQLRFGEVAPKSSTSAECSVPPAAQPTACSQQAVSLCVDRACRTYDVMTHTFLPAPSLQRVSHSTAFTAEWCNADGCQNSIGLGSIPPTISVTGLNFVVGQSSSLKCRFVSPVWVPKIQGKGTNVVDAKYKSPSLVTCGVPAFSNPTFIPTYVQVSSDGVSWPPDDGSLGALFDVVGTPRGVKAGLVGADTCLGQEQTSDASYTVCSSASVSLGNLTVYTIDRPPQGSAAARHSHRLGAFDTTRRVVWVVLDSQPGGLKGSLATPIPRSLYDGFGNPIRIKFDGSPPSTDFSNRPGQSTGQARTILPDPVDLGEGVLYMEQGLAVLDGLEMLYPKAGHYTFRVYVSDSSHPPPAEFSADLPESIPSSPYETLLTNRNWVTTVTVQVAPGTPSRLAWYKGLESGKIVYGAPPSEVS